MGPPLLVYLARICLSHTISLHVYVFISVCFWFLVVFTSFEVNPTALTTTVITEMAKV